LQPFTKETDDNVEFGPSCLPEIRMEEVSKHHRLSDAWMVIYDKVYDFTTFLAQVKKYSSTV
jgi:cytochrome b involved in lipid metabolism